MSVGTEAALARDADTELDVAESGHVVRVSADRDHHAAGARIGEDAPVEIEPVRIGVDLDRDACAQRRVSKTRSRSIGYGSRDSSSRPVG